MPKTTPDFSANSLLHQEAIANGAEHFRRWQRNVTDKFKPFSEEEIKKELRETAFPYAVLFEHWCNDFNVASGIRNANAFNAKEVYYIGNKKIDRRGAMGVQNYTNVNFLSTQEELLELKKQYTFIGVDNMPGAIPINSFNFQENMLFIFGEESVGLTPMMQSLCDSMIYIEQFGSVRSLNAAVASGIIMNTAVTYFRSHKG